MIKKVKPVMEKITKISPWMLDMTGMKSGLLTITNPHGRLKYPSGSITVYWNAVCECGNTHVVNAAKFNRGDIQSCGCLTTRDSHEAGKSLAGTVHTPNELRHSGHRYRELFDLTFGKLTVVDLSHAVSYEIHGTRTETKWAIYWICECACGKQVVRTARYLTEKGPSKSCGCTSMKLRNIRRTVR